MSVVSHGMYPSRKKITSPFSLFGLSSEIFKNFPTNTRQIKRVLLAEAQHRRLRWGVSVFVLNHFQWEITLKMI